MGRDDAYRGFEVWFNDFKMALKMYWVLGLVMGVVHLVLFALIARAWLGAVDAGILLHWVVARLQALSDPGHPLTFPHGGQVYAMSASQLAHYLEPHVTRYAVKLVLVFVATCGVYFAIPLFTRWFRGRARKIAGPEHVRGSRLADPKEFRRGLRAHGERLDLPLGDFHLPVDAEVKHTLILGRPGVGKSVALSAIIERVRARGGRGVLYDYKGDYTARFFRPGIDVLFNPLDTRCAGWNLFNDIETQMDVDALAASLIPRAYHADPFWNDAARAVFTGLLHHLYATGRRDNAALWEAVSSDIKDIAGWLRETPHGEAGYTFIQDAGSKQALSVHSVVMQYARAFEFLAGVSGDFSVVDWLRNRKGEPGWIFVTNYPDIQDTLRPILSLFVDLLGRKLLALPDDFDRRVFFFLDEFGTLQRLPTIVSLLTLSRSKGGSVWVGVQDVGQIDKLYTQDLRKAIVNACGNSLLFAVSDPDTAKYLSEKIGETEFVEMDQTYSMGPSEMRDGVALAQRKKNEPLVLPSELMALPDLTAYLRVGALPLTQTRFTFQPYPAGQAPFSVRPDLRLDAVGETIPSGPRKESSNGRGAVWAGDDKTLVFPYERGGEGDPVGEHALGDLPEWMEGPEPGEKTEGEEREEMARRDNEGLFHDGVGPAEMEHDDDSRAIEMPDGLEGPTA